MEKIDARRSNKKKKEQYLIKMYSVKFYRRKFLLIGYQYDFNVYLIK